MEIEPTNERGGEKEDNKVVGHRGDPPYCVHKMGMSSAMWIDKRRYYNSPLLSAYIYEIGDQVESTHGL